MSALPEKSNHKIKRPKAWPLVLAVIIFILILLILIFLQEKRIVIIEKGIVNAKQEFHQELTQQAVQIDELMYKIIQCESQWNEKAIGDTDYLYPAYGLIQIQKRTWDWLCKLSGKELDYYSPEDQVALLKWALENDYGYLWTCYRKFKGEVYKL